MKITKIEKDRAYDCLLTDLKPGQTFDWAGGAGVDIKMMCDFKRYVFLESGLTNQVSHHNEYEKVVLIDAEVIIK